VLPSLRVARVEVVWNGGSLPLRLSGNHFIGGSPLLYMPPFQNFPYIAIAYNARGKEVARKRLQSPGLLLLNGWKEYSREHKKWRQQRPRSGTSSAVAAGATFASSGYRCAGRETTSCARLLPCAWGGLANEVVQ